MKNELRGTFFVIFGFRQLMVTKMNGRAGVEKSSNALRRSAATTYTWHTYKQNENQTKHTQL